MDKKEGVLTLELIKEAYKQLTDPRRMEQELEFNRKWREAYIAFYEREGRLPKNYAEQFREMYGEKYEPVDPYIADRMRRIWERK